MKDAGVELLCLFSCKMKKFTLNDKEDRRGKQPSYIHITGALYVYDSIKS